MDYIIPDAEWDRKGAYGLFFPDYAIHAMRNGTITPRDAILVAHVERVCMPYSARQPELAEYDGCEGCESVEVRISYLREILCTTTRTANLTITRLLNHRRQLLKGKKVGRWVWQLARNKRLSEASGETPGGSLYVPHPIRKAFQAGDLTPLEMLAVGKISCFTRAGSQCYASNRWLGEFLGVGPQRAQQLVRQLLEKEWLTATYLTKDDLRDMLAQDGRDGYCGWGESTVRLLWPPRLSGLYSQTLLEDDETDEC
jgi:hypothetical protein